MSLSPTRNVAALPERKTRSLLISQNTVPPHFDNCRAFITVFSEPLRPIRSQGAVGRSCDRVFGNSDFRSEIAADEIDILSEPSSRSRDRDPLQVQSTQDCVVGGERAYLLGAFEDGDIGLSGQDLHRDFSQPHNQFVRRRTGFRWAGKSMTISPFLSSTARSPLRVSKTSEFPG